MKRTSKEGAKTRHFTAITQKLTCTKQNACKHMNLHPCKAKFIVTKGWRRSRESKMQTEQLSRWAFIAFVITAIGMGLVVGYMAYDAGTWNDPAVADMNGWGTLAMLILGIFIGITSITAKKTLAFLIATIALVVTNVADVWSPLTRIHELLYYWITAILNYIVAFAAPAPVIIAVNAVFAMTKKK